MPAEIRLDDLYNLMVKDMLESEPPFLSELWPTTGKVSRKINDVFGNSDEGAKFIKDVPSHSLNSHYSMRPPDDPDYASYRKNLEDFIKKTPDYDEDLIHVSECDAEAAVKTLYNICKAKDNFGVTKVSCYPTKHSFEHEGILLSWDHVISIWSVLQIFSHIPHLATDPIVALDLGSGWGRMGYILKKVNPRIAYIACDLPESLLVSQLYLPQTLPEEKSFLYHDNCKVKNFSNSDLINQGGIRFICPHDLPRLQDRSVDVLINIHSLAEMPQVTINQYHTVIRRLALGFYSLNRDRFDFKYGTGYFRQWIDINDDDVFRKPEGTRSSQSSRRIRQFPPWPQATINLLPESALTPWDPWFFEEVMLMAPNDDEFKKWHSHNLSGLYPHTPLSS